MKRTICFVAILLLSTIFLCSCRSEYYRDYQVEFFGDNYDEINYSCSAEDKAELEPVLKLAEKAFSAFPKNEKEAKKKFGKLYLYTNYIDDPNEIPVTEKHEIHFITGKTSGNSGYIWLNYSRSNYDANGELLIGDADINTRWELKKKNGEWTVTSTLEAP